MLEWKEIQNRNTKCDACSKNRNCPIQENKVIEIWYSIDKLYGYGIIIHQNGLIDVGYWSIGEKDSILLGFKPKTLEEAKDHLQIIANGFVQ